MYCDVTAMYNQVLLPWVQKEAKKGVQKEGPDRGVHILSTPEVTSSKIVIACFFNIWALNFIVKCYWESPFINSSVVWNRRR